MYRKLTFVISILILSLSIAYLGASAETDEDEIFEINLTFVSSGEEFYVPQGDKIVFKTRWSACTKGLAIATVRQTNILLSVDGVPEFSTPRESSRFWESPISLPIGDRPPCINGSDTIWRPYWYYEIGKLPLGSHAIHYEKFIDHPFVNGVDYDRDGKIDIINWDFDVYFKIIVEP